MGQTFVWVLIVAVLSHNGHGRTDGMIREHVSTYGNEDTCRAARIASQRYDSEATYFCQKELLK